MIFWDPIHTVRVKKEIHRNEYRYMLHFPYNEELANVIKQIKGYGYSNTKKLWYIPPTDESLKKLRSLGIYTIMDSRNYEGSSPPKSKKVIPIEKKKSPVESRKYKIRLNEDEMQRIHDFETYLKQKWYAERTIDSYVKIVTLFYVWLSKHNIDTIDKKTLVRFNKEYFIDENHSRSYQNIFINAIKLMHEKGDLPNINLEDIERPRRSNYLPEILSQDEVKRLIESYKNIKHKTIIMMYYACGLRKTELLNIKLEHLDVQRQVLHIRQAKGAKDRVVRLPEALIQQLKTYGKLYKPKVYLFNGQKSLQYSGSSVSKLLERGIKVCKIKKRITIHSLRHSFATHLVERNINLRYIQEALGHKSPKTTEIYTRLSKENVAKMVSPIDFWEVDS